MEEKQTNLALSADVTTSQELIKVNTPPEFPPVVCGYHQGPNLQFLLSLWLTHMNLL